MRQMRPTSSSEMDNRVNSHDRPAISQKGTDTLRVLPSPEKQGPGKSLKLPNSLKEYTSQPFLTLLKVYSWLNARWHFRKNTELGRWCRLEGHAFVKNEGEIRIGERVLMLSRVARSAFVVKPGGKLVIGDRTFINYGCDIGCTGQIKIGQDCMIGAHVTILDNNFHRIDDLNSVPEPQPVWIGDRVWIGNRSIILPGITIGDEAVIGAGSVVTKSVPPKTVVAGNPARTVKEL